MRKLIAIIKAFFRGGMSVDLIDKTRISRTPGDVTNVGHN
jgi:hypothetical protein